MRVYVGLGLSDLFLYTPDAIEMHASIVVMPIANFEPKISNQNSYPQSPSPAHSHPSSTDNLHKKKADMSYVLDKR